VMPRAHVLRDAAYCRLEKLAETTQYIFERAASIQRCIGL